MGGIFDLYKVKIYKNKIITSKIQQIWFLNGIIYRTGNKIVSDSGFFRNL
jgi:hypothetical protein